MLAARPCRLFVFIMVASYLSSGGDAESYALIVFLTRGHAPLKQKKKKKKKNVLLELGHRNEGSVT
jgi:hypothetical protein